MKSDLDGLMVRQNNDLGKIMMRSFLFQDESDIQSMRDLIARLPQKSTAIDFEETIQLDSVRASTRLWENGGQLIAFAYVDEISTIFALKLSHSPVPPGLKMK